MPSLLKWLENCFTGKKCYIGEISYRLNGSFVFS